jgi:hypothetical protein
MLAGAKLYSVIIITVIVLVLDLRWLPEVDFLFNGKCKIFHWR